jgi:two-component system sensor histidine kinase VicK
LNKNRFRSLSPAFEAVWETSAQKAHEDPASLLSSIHPNDQQNVLSYLQKLQAGSTYEEVEFKVLTPDEDVKVIRVEAYRLPVNGQEEAIIGGFAQDISRQKQYENYLSEFGHRKNSALEIVSHDLRGPLGLLQSLTQSLEHDLQDKKYEEIAHYAHLMQRVCQESLTLINDLLAEEHLRAPNVSVKKEWVDLVAKAKELVENYRASPTISQTFDVQAGTDQVFAEVDEVKFMQVLNNLISNAIKFSPADGAITVTITEEKRGVQVAVSDKGIGIPEKLYPYLFDKYTKASRVGLRGEKSHGIGLHIVRDLVEVQGGKIWFESQENDGTTFYLSLPRRD